jgi:outer membrane biosynthesis protein TonB
METNSNISFTIEKKKSALLTALIVTLCLLFFWIFGLKYQVPAPQNPSIAINFGTSHEGMGDIQPEESGSPEVVTDEVVPEVEESTPIESSTPLEKVMTQERVETVHVPTAEEIAETKRKEEEAEVKKLQEDAAKKAQSMWNKTTTNNPGSEGKTGKPGDQGDPNGSKEAKSHIGGSGGDGISHNFSNRRLVSTPTIIDNSQDEGKVVVEIVVDRNGKVIKATPGGIGSGTTSTNLFNKAKNAALKTKFSSNPNAPAEQYGQLTFVFVLE